MLVCRPLSGDLVVTSLFGGGRDVDGDGIVSRHMGVDYRAPVGSLVFSPFDGVVEKINTTTAGGLQLFVRSTDGRARVAFVHLDDVAAGVGQRVRAGDPIAQSGASGFIVDANGQKVRPVPPHLHVQLQLRNAAGDLEIVDPDKVFRPLEDPAFVGSGAPTTRKGGALVIVALVVIGGLVKFFGGR